MPLWDLPQKPKLLYVEDEKDVAEMLCVYFRMHGADAHHAQRGKQAIRLCARADFDLVILDVGLPDMTGYDVFRVLRQAGHKMPIIFLTQKAERMNRLAGLELGAVDYIVKPVDLDELRLRVRNALAHRVREVFPPTYVALLRQILAEHFDLEELRTLCFDLEINFDGLRGEGQEAKARELVAYLQRRERLDQLVSYLRQHRPDIKL
jgi:DNA-binding response OmpR family regulator